MILVTGGAGYIGSVTMELLLAAGESVLVLDNLSRGHRGAVPPNVPFYQGSVGDRQLLTRVAREHDIESCIHFAAFAEVAESVAEPALYFENNVEEGIALLDVMRKAGVRRLVFSSTSATYGEPRQLLPITEQHPQEPTSPYGWSKMFTERILEAYDTAYGLKFVALRYFNAAGATERLGECHDPELHLIPNVLAVAMRQADAVSVFGDDYPTEDGTPVRDYIHVADLGTAHIQALKYLRAGGDSAVLNLGNGRGYSVLQVIESARQVTGRKIAARFERRRPGDPSHLIADASRARALLGWQPAHPDLTEIVRTDWEWRMKHPRGYE
jgi:UDP-glucose 4-epimerase